MNVNSINTLGDPGRISAFKPTATGLSPDISRRDSSLQFNPIKEAFKSVNDMQIKASESTERFSVGDADSIHKVVIDMEEAFLSLKMAVQVRNKAVEAYQEIMRMQM